MNLKKYLPFIIPTLSLLLVLFLAFRWYNLRTQRDNDLEFDEVEIQELTDEEIGVMIDALDSDIIPLETKDEQEVMGQVRYQIEDDKVLFNVFADLVYDEAEVYQTWISPLDEDKFQPAFTLEHNKGGYMGSASISREQLPIELMVTRDTEVDNGEMGEALLRGVIEENAVEEEVDLE